MTRLQANMVLMLTALIWGSTFVVQQVSTGSLGAVSFTSARFFLGALIVLPFAVVQYKQRKKERHRITVKDWGGMIVTGLALFSGAVLQQIGVFHTSVANAGFLTALYVPLVPVISFFVLKKNIHWSVWPASAGCLAGTFIMSGAQNLTLNAGDVWVITSAFFWAFHVILVGTMASRTQAPLVVAVVQFFTCSAAGLIVGFFVEHPGAADFTSAWFGIFFAGFLSVGVAFTLQVVAQRYTEAADSAIILSAETVFAALAGLIFIGERLSPMQTMGAAMILSCILAVQLLPLYTHKQALRKKTDLV